MLFHGFVDLLLSFHAFFSKTDFVKVLSNVCKKGAKVMAEKATRHRDGGFLGEKGKDVVVNPGGWEGIGGGHCRKACSRGN